MGSSPGPLRILDTKSFLFNVDKDHSNRLLKFLFEPLWLPFFTLKRFQGDELFLFFKLWTGNCRTEEVKKGDVERFAAPEQNNFLFIYIVVNNLVAFVPI